VRRLHRERRQDAGKYLGPTLQLGDAVRDESATHGQPKRQRPPAIELISHLDEQMGGRRRIIPASE
jgi:hypothetical protein